MSALVVLAAVLGVASRLEETSGVSAGVSTDATWLALAFAAGVVHRGAGAGRAALAGSVVLSIANAAYYAWVALTEPGAPLASAAGAVLPWFALGVAGGALFALAGRVWAASGGPLRLVASVPLAGVCIPDGLAHRDTVSGVAIAVAGVSLPLLSADVARERWAAGLFAAATVALAVTGQLDPLLP